MERLFVRGAKPLQGEVTISGAKNAVLPILAACLLPSGRSTILEVPNLSDVSTILQVLESLGARICQYTHKVSIDATEIYKTESPYEYVRKMRASFLVMGPLLARLGKARISLPGGCAIGTRPIDLHLKGFAALGAEIVTGNGYIEARVKHQKLVGTHIYLDFPSVGATENIMMAAVLAQGDTTIKNAAAEPEIVDLANFLIAMGAKISGVGTNIIKIEGVNELRAIEYTVIPDRIEAGTYMIASAITNGDILIKNVLQEHLQPLVVKLRETGVTIETCTNGIRVLGNSKIEPVTIKTLPYPGFPTDMQAQMMALLTLANGTSVITETVFENRFMHVNELIRMGAKIKIEGKVAIIEGAEQLTAAPVKASDLRAGASLVLAALAAKGTTEISNIHHIDRGYECMEQKLIGLGADIQREMVHL